MENSCEQSDRILLVVHYNGEENCLINVDKFEFRTNHISNWLKVKFKDGHEEMLRSIATIKTM